MARSSEKFEVKAGGKKGSEAYNKYIENLLYRQRRFTDFAAGRSRKKFWDGF